MISDYMDQSLILLKNELRWEIDDICISQSILGWSLTASAEIWCNEIILFRPNNSKAVLSDELKAKIRSWNRADSVLFDAVNSTF